MSGHTPDRPHSTPAEFELLLGRAKRAARAGNVVGARALLRALTRQYPHEEQAWRLLAELAETPAEQQAVYEHLRHRGGQHAPQTAATGDVAAPGPAESRSTHRFPVMALAISAIALFVLVWIIRAGFPAEQPAGTTAEPAAQQAAEGAAPDQTTTDTTSSPLPGPLPSATPSPLPSATPSPLPSATPSPLPSATPSPPPTPVPFPTTVNMGAVLTHDGWYATLGRPEHAQVLNQAPEGITVQGQFAVVVPAVSNTGDTPRQMPPDLFALVDQQGRLYRPLEGASTAYLQTYGRGQYGDLALEDVVPAGGGRFSVPLLFDIAPDATNLVLTMGPRAQQGWQVANQSEQTAYP